MLESESGGVGWDQICANYSITESFSVTHCLHLHHKQDN